MRGASVIAVLLLSVFGCSAPRPGISGRIENLPDGTPLYLCVYEGALRTMDSTVSAGGGFRFDMPQIIPNILYLRIGERSGTLIPFFIEGMPVEISGEITSPHNIRAEGGESNELLASYRLSIEDIEIKLKAIEVALEEPGAPEEELSVKRDSIELLLEAKKVAFVRENNRSIAAAFLVSTMIDPASSGRRTDYLIGLLDTVSMADNAFLRRLRRVSAAARQ